MIPRRQPCRLVYNPGARSPPVAPRSRPLATPPASPPAERAGGSDPALRDAGDLAAFAHLFRERREAERRPGGTRAADSLARMEALGPSVQRALERAGRSWVVEPEGGRPTPLVHLLTFGEPADYAPHADRALEALASAEALHRSGDLRPGARRRRRRHDRSSRRGRRPTRWQVAAIAALVLGAYAVVLANLGSWS